MTGHSAAYPSLSAERGKQRKTLFCSVKSVTCFHGNYIKCEKILNYCFGWFKYSNVITRSEVANKHEKLTL